MDMRGFVRTLLLAALLLAAAVVGTLWLSGRGEKFTSEPVSETQDTLLDARDGKKYRTTVIGGARWMAENLNYRPRWGWSWCYDKDDANCDMYGRLYNRKTAKTVCPAGWHLPSRFEWDDLAAAAGGPSVAGKALKTKSGWNDYRTGGWNDFAGSGSGNGTDEYGFSAQPGGVRTADDRTCRTGGYFDRYGPVGYCHAGEFGKWWTASEEEFESAPGAYTRSISNGWDAISDGLDDDDRHAFSVRCVHNGYNAEEKERRRIDSLSAYFTDSRDGRVYRAVTIGDNEWMAQNLDYTPETGGSWCYENNDSNCVKYGRLYDWNTAMEACPVGWRLPSREEWDSLGRAVGGEITVGTWLGENDVYLYGVGDKLKAKKGWKRFGYGADDYGFSALPGGRRLTDGGFDDVGGWGAWWTSSKEKSGYPYHRRMFYDEDFMNESGRFAGSASSVRCVRERSDISEWKLKREAELREREANRKKLEAEEEEKTKKLSVYFTDTRDGRKYRAVNIGGKAWMAENLNYQPKTGVSWCYKNDGSNCGKYGRLYDWETAKTACPSGWRLPSGQEWDSLAKAVGGERMIYYYDTVWVGAAKALKAASGWDDNGDGTDDYRFSALPGGYHYHNSLFTDVGEVGEWWTATEGANADYACYRRIHRRNDDLNDGNYDKRDGRSVRCVQDAK